MTGLKCTKCGKVKQAGQPRLGKLITKYGTIEKLQQEFVCAKCKAKDKPKKEKATKEE